MRESTLKVPFSVCEVARYPSWTNLTCCGPCRDAKELAGILDNNILGPLRACQAFVPLLNGNTATKNDAASKLILLSSDLSSLEIATQGSEAYSISKVQCQHSIHLHRSSRLVFVQAGLNMMGRKLSYELKPSKVAVGLLHPGWVQVRLFCFQPYRACGQRVSPVLD